MKTFMLCTWGSAVLFLASSTFAADPMAQGGSRSGASDPSQRVTEGSTLRPEVADRLLLDAVQKRNPHAVRTALARGASASAVTKALIVSVSTPDRDGETKNLEVTRALIEGGADVNYVGGSLNDSVLDTAAQYGNDEIVDALIKAGAKVTPSALFHAAQNQGDRSGPVRVLAKAKVDLNTLNKNGSTALMLAAFADNATVIAELANAGADLNAREPPSKPGAWVKGSHTALMIAAVGRHVKALRALIEAGADVTLKDEDGQAALASISGRGYEDPKYDEARTLLRDAEAKAH